MLLAFLFPLLLSSEVFRTSEVFRIANQLGFILPKKRVSAPDFFIPALSKKLSELEGVKVINFWAPDCPPCVRELPELEKLWRTFEGEVWVIGVCPSRRWGRAKKIVRELGLTFPIVKDGGNRIRQLYKVRAYPTTYIILADGKFFAKVVGEFRWSSPKVLKLFRRLLLIR